MNRAGGTPAVAVIGIDWGSTYCRALALDAQGQVLAAVHEPLGVKAMAGRSYPRVLEALLGTLQRDADLRGAPVLLGGMVGSAAGWLAVPYLPTPCGAAGLAQALHWLPASTHGLARAVAIVPGLTCPPAADAESAQALDFADVMRGEEIQVLGACQRRPATRHLLLPGTHSKWVRVDEGARIGHFATRWTGELYALARQHSLLGAAMREGAWSQSAFDHGVRVAQARPDWLHQLFGVRARGVLGAIEPEALPAFLSGLLIGYECVDAQAADPQHPILIVASASLAGPYRRALSLLGRAHDVLDGDTAVAQGFAQLHHLLPTVNKGSP